MYFCAMRKFSNKILHFIGVPLFFIAFVLLYRPENTLDFISKGIATMEFNLTILGCITLVTLAITRIILHFTEKKNNHSSAFYMCWCFGEIVICSLFCALYLHLIQSKVDTFFSVAATCISRFSVIWIWPYFCIGVLSILKEKTDILAKPVIPEDEMLHFKDSSQKLKLIVTAQAILYIEAKANYVEIVYKDAEDIKHYSLRSSMKRLESMLTSHGLYRCHRTFFINPKHVKALSKDSKGYVFADLDTASCPAIPISKTYYDSISAVL